MSHSTAHFVFDDSVPMAEVEETLRLALLAAQSLHGKDRLRLEAHIQMDHPRHRCLVDTTAEVGRTLALIFAGFVRREFGEEAVRVERDVQYAGASA